MYFSNASGSKIVYDLISTIQKNKEYLSQIDGEIGDGDHGINMSKGFGMAGEELSEKRADMSAALEVLGDTLLTRIGGSMGPLYGTLFLEMAQASKNAENIDGNVISDMLGKALEGLSELTDARPGDKTLMDVLVPAVEAYQKEISKGSDTISALASMKAAAEKGRDMTKDMTAKKGRSSRLGERSRGVLDAGAVSCSLILGAFADAATGLLQS